MKTIILQAGYSTATLIFVLIICIVVFLAIREIMTWYWKIDTIIKNQEKQITLFGKLIPEHGSIADKAKKYDALEEAKKREHNKV